MNASQHKTSASRILLAIVGLVIIVSLFAYFNRGYGKVSDSTYRAATAIYGACLAKNDARIDAVQTLIDSGSEEFDTSQITTEERKWLQSMIREAKSGEWDSAANAAKQLMEAQNEPAGSP